MGTLAVLFAVLAVAVPLHKSASADEPPSVTITISDENYETATATITATGVTFDDWRLRVEYVTLGEDPYSRYTGSTPGLTASDLDVFSFLSNYDDNADTLSAEFTLPKLVPASDYTVTVKLSSPSFSDIYTDTATFSTKSGCYQHDPNTADPAIKPGDYAEKGFSGNGRASKVTRTELVMVVPVTNDSDVIEKNTGRCVYYYYTYYDGPTQVTVPATVNDIAYVHQRGTGGNNAWIELKDLIPGTYYHFNVSFHPTKGSGRNHGFGGTTLAPALIIIVDDIEQTSAEVTVTLPADLQDEGERMIHLVAYKTADEYDPDLNSKQVKPEPETTENSSTSFALSNLTPGTEYKVKASLMWSFPTHHTASKTFTTKLEPPGKPTDLEVEPGDRQLEVSWDTPAAAGVADEYIVQWKSGSETFQNATDDVIDDREALVTYVPGTTTYETTIFGLTNGTKYTLHVIAKNDSGQATSDTATGTPDVLPNKPTIQSVVEGHMQLVVTWDEPANTGSDITGYVVQWKSGNQEYGGDPTREATKQKTEISHEISHEITGLDNDTEYTVRVRAVNGLVLPVEDDYNWSDEETGTPRPEPIVTGVTVADATITRTEATATVTIENETDDGQTVHLQYRKTTSIGWTPVSPKDVTATATSETFNLRSLTGNTDYVVEAWLATTDNIKGSATFKTGPVEPDAPRDVEITGFGDGDLTVAWDAPLGNGGSIITGYKVQWKPDSQNDWNTYTERDDDDGQSPYTIKENLTNGTKYDVRVLAVNDVGNSPPSGDVEGTPSTRPKPPTITDITHGHQKLTVTWTAPTDADTGGSDLTGFIVQWKWGNNDYNTTYQATPPASPYEITNLINGTEYTVRVFAVNESYPDDPSDESNEMTGTPSTVPQPPTDVTITGFGDKSLTVSWTAPTGANTGGSDITGFKIQWKLNSEADWNTNTYTEIVDDDNQSPYTITETLENGKMYDVRVVAVNINGDSRESDSATGTPSRKPDAPTGVDITDYGNGWLEVTWTAVMDEFTGGSPIKNYIVQWKSGTDDYSTTKQATPTESPYKITNLKNGTEYTVRVLAVNETYPNDPSDDPDDGTNEDKETPRTKPKPPTGVNIAESGNRYLKVAWTAPEDNGGSALASFKVQWKYGTKTFQDAATDDREQTVTAVSSTTTYETTISDLANGTKYTMQVLAVNGNRASDNTSDSSNTASGTPSTTPDAPKSVTITNKGDRTLTVMWEPPDEIGGLAITNYKVQWMGEDDTEWTSPANDKGATDRSHEIRDLTNGEIYTVQVFAKNANGYSNKPGEVTGVPSKRPDPPTDVEVSAHGDRWLEVIWTEPEDKGGLPTTYIVQWKWGNNDYNETNQADPATSPQEITSLLNGTEYTVRVLAKNDRGKSGTSNEPKGTPSTKPQPPTDVSIAKFGDKSLTVSWTAPTGANTGGSDITGFKIQWKLNSEADWNTNTYTEIVDDDNQSPYTITETLENGKMYDVRVVAVNINGDSRESDSATGTPSRKPDAPTGVDITDYGNGWLEVTWTAVMDEFTGGSPIKNYIVQWKSGTDDYSTTKQATPTESPYKITNLKNGTEYTVRVLAVNETYPNDPSDDPDDGTNEDKETPRTIPGPPTELGVISGHEELTVSWKAPVPEKNGGAGINQFIVQWKSGNQDYDTSRQKTTLNTSQVIKPLTNGTPYSIQVRADNGEEPEGEQNYNWEETTGTPMTVPGAPTSLEVEEGHRQLIVSWVAPTDTGGVDIEIDHFVVQWKLKTVDNWNTPREHTTRDKTVLTDTITGLDNGETYDIRVRADNDVEGQTFKWAYTSGKPRTIPGPPTSLRVAPGNRQLTLSWVAPRDKGGLTINRYIVQWKSGIQQYDTSRQATPITTSQVIGQLTNGTPHFVRVRADNTVVLPNEDSYNWAFGNDTPAAVQNPPPYNPPQQNNPPPQRSPVNPTPPVTKSPEVSKVTFADILQTSANATVKIKYAGTSQKTVRLRYRIEDTTAWSAPPKSENTSGSSTTIPLSSLTAGTSYEVQAWLNTSLPPAGTKIYEFDTLDEPASAPVPAISDLKCENIGQTSATAMVEIVNAGTEMKEVFLKHSMDGTDEWTQIPFPTITYADSTSINLTGLQEGTTYQVVVALSDDFSGMVIEACATLIAPSLSGVSIGSKTQTSAVATVSIANAGTTQKTVLLQYREFGESDWGEEQRKTTAGANTDYNLIGLEPRTTYEVKAYLSDDPDAPKYAVFTTLAPGPSVSGVGIGSITQISAVATVKIAYAGNAQKTVHLHYRKFGESEWIAKTPKTTEGASESFDLTGLTPNTKYEVEASLSSNFAGAKAVTFTTLAPEPSVSSVRVEDISQTAATAIAAIANSDGTSRTVHVRYRTTTPQGEWRNAPETTSTTEVASTGLMGLTADTEYEVQASLDGSFPDDLTKNATFTTLRFPSISNLEVEDETKNSATAVITIADPDGSSQTIHLRHRTTTPQGEWSRILETSSTTAEASLGLKGLAPDTEYEAEVSLTDDFGVSETDTFRTLPLDPVVSKVSVNSIRQTTATAYIDIANANGNTQTVSLRYRTTTPRGAWSGIKTATSDTDNAEIDLTELTPGTEYDVQASLENSFPSSRTRHDTFTTLRWPSISTFEVENVGRNGATVGATIADSRGVAQTVHVRHRATGYIAWRPTQQMDSVDDIASLRLRGLSSGTEYDAEASLDESFPSDETMSVTFTTVKRKDDDDASSSGSGIVQAARAVNIPLLGFSPQMLRFVAIEGGDNPAPQTFSVWNRAQGTMNFTLSNHEEWLSQYPLSGVSTGPADAVAISASVDISGLPEGQYVDVINIQISPAGKTPGQVIVVLDVLPPDYIRQFVSRDEGGVITMPDSTVKLVVPPGSPPKDVDIELMKLNTEAHGEPPRESERVVLALNSNTYAPGGDTPEEVVYSPAAELWLRLPSNDRAACDEGKTRVYSVEVETWSLVENRCETDESGHVWAVTQVERLGQFALVIDDAPLVATPIPMAAAVAATPTAVPASAPAVAVQRISLPAQPPTPTPNAVPTAVPAPVGKRTVAPAMEPTPTPTSVPGSSEPPAPVMQASVAEGGSGTLGRIVLATLGAPLLIGALIVAYLLYRERRRRGNLNL